MLMLSAGSTAFAQLNMSVLSHLPYNVDLNDIWGWVAPDGTEYALVGAENGVSIVSLADPTNAQEVAFVPGQNSIWRDIKTWGNFAYVTCDQSGTTEGLLIIDLSDLPNGVTYTNWRPQLPSFTNLLNTCHNLYIDENGYCYVSGCNINSGGVIILDVHTTPGTPIYLGHGPATYSHDVYVRNNRMYSSEIYAGVFGVYDVTDKANPAFLANHDTPFAFTHNSWLSDDGNTLFTTDEKPNAFVGSYDISDLGDIQELDRYRPQNTVGQGVIPHNVHVWNDYLIISYYTNGCMVVDASHPDNLIEVGNLDTYLGGNGGFSGAWGAYPFLPSGNVLVSDINTGLWVLAPNYIRGCRLEGTVTSSSTGETLTLADVEILGDEPNDATTDLMGVYKTGQATPGTFDVVFSKEGYHTKTVPATLANGQLTTLNVELDPLVQIDVIGTTITSATGDPVPNAQVVIFNDSGSYELSSDANGNFSLNGIFQDTYTIAAGQWGYLHKALENVEIQAGNPITIALDKGYQDDFIFEQGWTTDATITTTSGFWVRDIPQMTSTDGETANPGEDIDGDIGNQCFVTGNNGETVSIDDVDGGNVYLTSPVMDLTTYNDPIVSYNLWFYNGGGNSTPNDSLMVSISNGSETAVLEVLHTSMSQWRPRSEFHVGEYLTVTDNMTLTVTTGDGQQGHLVEGGFDAFLVTEGMATGVETPSQTIGIKAYPNPSSGAFTLDYHIDQDFTKANLQVFNTLGQLVYNMPLVAEHSKVNFGDQLEPGVYFVVLVTDKQTTKPIKLIRSAN